MTRVRMPHLSPLVRGIALASLAVGVGVAALAATWSPSEPPAPAAQLEDGELLQAPLDPREPLPPPARRWVDETLGSLSLEERVGQVMMVRVNGAYYPADAEHLRTLVGLVQDLHLGGVILFRSGAYGAAALLSSLQAAANESGTLPLLVAADFEWGADFRVDGALPYPTAMAVGSTGDTDAAEWMGRATARDARALGVHWIFAPVADVNINPDNPVINVRAFGEAPELVSRMVAGFVRGAQEGGVLATAKHFPGHGDTGVDSHIALPVLEHDAERLRTVELSPFRAAIDAGVASVMTAHIAVPALTGDPELPATLSPTVLTDLLRGDMGFRGLVVTDAMEMGGISRRWWSGEAAVEALAAGADMILLAPNPRAVHAAIVRAVRLGKLPPERLEEAVRRVLEAKARTGLDRGSARRPLEALGERFAPAAEAERVQRVADAAITLLRDRERVLPLDARRWQDVVVVGVSDSDSPAPTGELVATLREALGNVRSFSIDGRTDGDDVARILTAAARARTVILGVRVAVRTAAGTISLPPRQAAYAEMLADLAVPTVVVALGSPYSTAAFPQASTVLAAYGSREPLQRAAARAILGAIPISGTLPVQVPGAYHVGHGEVRPRLDATLRMAAGHEDGELPAVDLAAARGALRRAVDARAFPGAVYAVGWRNHLIGLSATGHMSYGADAPPMRPDALFDLASMTKVVATTTVAMMAVERGYLRLDYAVESLVPEFRGPDKSRVTVAHLLTHTSGLPAYVEFFRDHAPDDAGEGAKRAILERIYATELEAAPGSRYAYSDLGVILLGEVLDRALGESYADFAEREIFRPIGMHDTGWTPPSTELPRIPPTERDPWRDRLVQGEVHDENAYVMGGVAPHAGLFSTATDLSLFAQTMLNLGTYDHHRLLERSTIAAWRRRQDVVPDSSRALGWDTAHGSDRWHMFAPEAYGHTGFTGTSIWIDPTRDLFVILLTNRVHPTRDNRRHIQARIDFHTAVVAAIDAAAGR